jgi:hypothetical protein
MKELHEKYGDGVRIGPNAVSFTGSAVWNGKFPSVATREFMRVTAYYLSTIYVRWLTRKHIFNARKKGQQDYIRDPKIHRPLPGTIGLILSKFPSFTRDTAP